MIDQDRLSEVEEKKRESVAQLLFRCARIWNEQAIVLLREWSQNPNIRKAHTFVFPHVDFEGTRLTEIARRIGVTKQAAAQWVNELEEMGMLEKVPDPSDGRAKLVRFSKQGQGNLLVGLQLLKETEHVLTQRLGQDQMDQLRSILLKLMEPLEEEMLLEELQGKVGEL